MSAIHSISAHAEQRLCVKHLCGNWKNKYSGLKLKDVMWTTARSIAIPLWEREMQRVKDLNEGEWKDTMDTPAQLWTISHFKTYTKCDMQVNNM